MIRGFTIALLGFAVAFPAIVLAARHDRHSSVSTGHESPVRECADIRVLFDGREAVRSEQRLSPARGSVPLSLRLPENSGAYIRGTDRDDFSILACKAAESAETLARVAVSFDRASLSVHGPEGDGWVVHFLVEAPRRGELDLAGRNGPIDVSDMAGRVTAEISNGPLAFRNCSGSIEARAENGPISLDGGSGDVRARADNGPISVAGGAGNVKVDTENGPISVRLRGTSWENGSLEAHAVNGPLSLAIPSGYRTGTVVESAGHSPFDCRAEACGEARKTSESERRRLEFGQGTTGVRLTTVNGPVSVQTAREP
jgi:hypothetical protein